jgi:UDP-GlcNAc:undecaprenyl-phosphate/decaprenyl-phosphate GlcNAc-1-phosphate transferase
MISLLPLIAPLAQAKPQDLPRGVVDRIDSIGRDVDSLRERLRDLEALVGLTPDSGATRLEVFHGYVPVFMISFLVALLATPIMRRLALANGVVDHPGEARKVHRTPVAYLGGAAIFLGIMAGVFYSYLAAFSYDPTAHSGLLTFHHTQFMDADAAGMPHTVPVSIIFGMTLIMLVGLLDDVTGIPPRVKVGGQLVAAAALAATDVGVNVAAGVLVPLAKSLGVPTTLAPGGNFETILFNIPLPASLHLGSVDHIPIDIVYWAGTLVIAVFVLGACNASNLIDGLDGLASGITGIASFGLLVIALGLAVADDGPRDGPRIILCLALLGACLGFLPHNFNPATIFLGDAGSLLLGFCTIVIILTLGDKGQTHLVFAGLIIYAIPIIDTVLAIIRRKLAGKPLSTADDQHLHHMLKKALGVKGAVLTLYGIAAGFAVLGILMSLERARVIYSIALVFAAFIVVTAIKIARRKQIEEQAIQYASGRLRRAAARNPATPAQAPAELEKVPPG